MQIIRARARAQCATHSENRTEKGKKGEKKRAIEGEKNVSVPRSIID